MANQEDDSLNLFLNMFLLPNEPKSKEEQNELFKIIFR